jgi:hypothetical protein
MASRLSNSTWNVHDAARVTDNASPTMRDVMCLVDGKVVGDKHASNVRKGWMSPALRVHGFMEYRSSSPPVDNDGKLQKMIDVKLRRKIITAAHRRLVTTADEKVMPTDGNESVLWALQVLLHPRRYKRAETSAAFAVMRSYMRRDVVPMTDAEAQNELKVKTRPTRRPRSDNRRRGPPPSASTQTVRAPAVYRQLHLKFHRPRDMLRAGSDVPWRDLATHKVWCTLEAMRDDGSPNRTLRTYDAFVRLLRLTCEEPSTSPPACADVVQHVAAIVRVVRDALGAVPVWNRDVCKAHVRAVLAAVREPVDVYGHRVYLARARNEHDEGAPWLALLLWWLVP